jgi:hypothetical protein
VPSTYPHTGLLHFKRLMVERTAEFLEAPTPGLHRVQSPRRKRRLACVLCSVLGGFALHTKPCSAQSNTKNECVASYQQAQVSRQEGDLLKAQQELVSCAGAGCPDAMQADCSRWLEEVQTALPSVVFRALTPNGADVPDARIELDGQPERALDGRSTTLNPGQHQVTVRAPHFAPITLQVQFVEGQKLRQQALTLHPVTDTPSAAGPAAPTAAAGSNTAARRFTVVQWVGASGAIAGGLGFTYFGLKARAGDSDLGACSPTCSKGAVADVKRNYLAANVSLGLGLVGLAVAAVHYFTQGSSPALNAAPKRGSSVAARTLQVELGPSFSGLSGSF